MTIDIGGELITLNVEFDDQNNVRDTEKALARYFDHLKKEWPEKSDRNLLALTAFQFAKSYYQILKLNEEATDTTKQLIDKIELASKKPSDRKEAVSISD